MNKMSRLVFYFLTIAGLLSVGTTSRAQIPIPQPGIISTVAGVGTPGFAGDNGLAVNAEVSAVVGVALDRAGNVYIADSDNNRVRKVDAATGEITTLATISSPSGIAIDASGNIYAASVHDVYQVSAATGAAEKLPIPTGMQLRSPQGLSVDSVGNVYIADAMQNQIFKFDVKTKVLSAFAGSGAHGYSGDGGPALQATISAPTAVAVDGVGNVFIMDYSNYVIRKVDAKSGNISTYAGNGVAGHDGDGGPATAAKLGWSEGLAVDSAGNVCIPEYVTGKIRRVDASNGTISTVVGQGESKDHPLQPGDGIPAMYAQVVEPLGLAFDGSGNMYIAETGSYRVRIVGASTQPASSVYVTVSSSDPKPTMGEAVTLTATIIDEKNAAVPSGSVSWFNGNTAIGQSNVDSDGIATVITTLGPGGDQQISARYTGAVASAGKLTLSVSGYQLTMASHPAFSLPPNTSSFPVAFNASAFYGFTGTVALSCSGMPAPGSCQLSTNAIAFSPGMTGQTVTMTVNFQSTTAAQASPSLPAGLVVAILCPFFLLGIGSRRVRRSFAGMVFVIAAVVAGAGMVGCGSKSNPAQSTTPTLNSVPAGNYTVVVTATSGANTVTVPVSITVQ